MQQEQRTRLLRRMMLAINRIDGAYYLFARRRGIHENTLALLYALDDGTPTARNRSVRNGSSPKPPSTPLSASWKGRGF